MLYGISGAYQPSVQASIPALVETDHVMTANAMINMISSLSGLLGPALGGIAYSMWGIYSILYTAVFCFFVSAVMEIFIHIPFVKRERTQSILRETRTDLKESLSFITREKPEIGKLTLCCAGVNLVLSSLMIIGLPVIVMQLLDFSAAQASRLYGFMEGILAVGGLAGGISAGALGARLEIRKSWKILLYGGILLVPMGIVLFVDCSPWTAYFILAAAGMVMMALAAVYSIQIMSFIQIAVPQEMVGKVIAWAIAVSTCAQPIGQVVYGVLFEQLKQRAGAVFFAAAVVNGIIAIYNKRSAEKL